MCLREREPLILSQQELGLNFGLVSSAQQETFLSWLPKGGAPAPATNTAAQARDEEGSVRMERHSGFQEQEHVLDLWSTQVTQNDAEKKKELFPPIRTSEVCLQQLSAASFKIRAFSPTESQWLLLETSTIPTLGDYQYKLTAYGFAALPHGNIFHCLGSLDTSICLKFITCSIIQTLLRENNG